MNFSLPESMELLARTPATLRALFSGLPESWLQCCEQEGSFSPHEVLGHLIHAEHTDWIPRCRRILESGPDRPFDPFDRRGHESFTATKSTAALLDDFESVRAESLAALRSLNLDDAALERTGTHPAFGTVTLRQLLATWVVHDLNHLSQIARIMARQYRTAVGPWREYLSIL